MRRAFFATFFLVSGGCLIATDQFGFKQCHAVDDCPGVAGYICASTAVWPQRGCGDGEKGCVCEVRFPPEPGGIQTDGGTPPVPDAGPPPDYCTEIRPILQLKCLGTCHGSQMQDPDAPKDFRLDYWEPDDRFRAPDGGPGLPGVKSKVDRVDDRIYVNPTMPPVTFPLMVTSAERQLVHKWFKRGAPLGDGGCELPGAPDGGGMDGGSDAGVPVRFANQVLPIFQGNCGCHITGTSGTLSLTAANAYNMLVNANTSATCNMGMSKRVVANSPTTSMLLLKLGNDPAKCNNFMPNMAAMPFKLSNPVEYGIIERWVQQGAPNN